jgi:2-iminobutanoate/2-iminopropanoate deaminase
MSLERKKIESKSAPAAIGPYSQAIAYGDLVFCSGQVGFNPETMKLEDGGVEAQTRRVLKNLAAVLSAAGSSPAKILKTTCFLTDLKTFEVFNKEYEAFMKAAGVEVPPARSTIEVSALPRGAVVEVEAFAVKG